jgi:hypothetical protein
MDKTFSTAMDCLPSWTGCMRNGHLPCSFMAAPREPIDWALNGPKAEASRLVLVSVGLAALWSRRGDGQQCHQAVKIEREKSCLARNHDVVRACELLIAAPSGNDEKIRSGTWATGRFGTRESAANACLFCSWMETSLSKSPRISDVQFHEMKPDHRNESATLIMSGKVTKYGAGRDQCSLTMFA